MTESVRDEMRYYKQLAIAVEERLNVLRVANGSDDSSESSTNALSSNNAKAVADAPTKDKNWRSMSEEEISCPNDSFTASTDLNNYMNNTITSSKSNSAESTPENYKPQVPKTLDIIPITTGICKFNIINKKIQTISLILMFSVFNFSKLKQGERGVCGRIVEKQ